LAAVDVVEQQRGSAARTCMLKQQNTRPVARAGREPIDLVVVAESRFDSQLHAVLSDGQRHAMGHTVRRLRA